MTIRRHVLAGIAAVLAAPLAVSAPAFASDLPDLGGKTVVVVTENAYPRCSSWIPNPARPSAGNMTR